MEIVILLLAVITPLLISYFLSRGIYQGMKRREQGGALAVSIIVFLVLLALMFGGLFLWAFSAFDRG